MRISVLGNMILRMLIENMTKALLKRKRGLSNNMRTSQESSLTRRKNAGRGYFSAKSGCNAEDAISLVGVNAPYEKGHQVTLSSLHNGAGSINVVGGTLSFEDFQELLQGQQRRGVPGDMP